jgi:hypothetical protein
MYNSETYDTISRPYSSLLSREGDINFVVGDEVASLDSIAPTEGTGTGTVEATKQPTPVEQPVGEKDMADMWITTFIRSANWKPKKFGFYIDGQTGYAEFANVFVSGHIEALTGTIGGWQINSGSLTDATGTVGMSSVVTGGDDIRFWAGNVNPALAPFSVTESGYLKAAYGNIGGWTINATTLSTTGIILNAGTQSIQVGASSPITIDGVTKSIESSNYVSGVFGSGFHLDEDLLEVGNIACRGLIRTAVFQRDVISSVGGSLVVLDSDVLDEDMDALD